jgi:hypothetical protein
MDSSNNKVQEIKALLDTLTEDEKSSIVGHLSESLFIPQWYTKDDLEEVVDNTVDEETLHKMKRALRFNMEAIDEIVKSAYDAVVE